MPFASILFADDSPRTDPAPIPRSIPREPAFYVDLNLDQVVADLTAGRARYHLEEFYRAPLHTVPAVGYRQQIFQDLERGDLRARMAAFADRMTRIRQGLPQAAELRQPRRVPRLPGEMNHVEAGVLDLVAEIYPGVVADLDRYCADHQSFLDATIAAFDRHLQFHLAYLDYIEPMKQAGLPFCYPQISGHTKDIHAERTFDLALARKLTLTQPGTVVCNDFSLTGPERILVISGPNNGGKTTFARTFGQLHYLAELGVPVPVPGRSARPFLCDQLFTHFERAEAPESLLGKLQEDLVRIHSILDAATGHSIVIMNELFTSTTLHDAVFLGTNIIQAIVELDLRGVYVTFVDDLARLVSMVSTVEPDNPTARTYRLVRKPADGNAYAACIAQRFGLDYPRLKKRLAS